MAWKRKAEKTREIDLGKHVCRDPNNPTALPRRGRPHWRFLRVWRNVALNLLLSKWSSETR